MNEPLCFDWPEIHARTLEAESFVYRVVEVPARIRKVRAHGRRACPFDGRELRWSPFDQEYVCLFCSYCEPRHARRDQVKEA